MFKFLQQGLAAAALGENGACENYCLLRHGQPKRGMEAVGGEVDDVDFLNADTEDDLALIVMAARKK